MEVERVKVEWMEVPVMQIIGRICHFCDLKRDTRCITDGSFERKAQIILCIKNNCEAGTKGFHQSEY